MARKSKAEILAEERALAAEIEKRTEDRVAGMLPDLMAKATAAAFDQLSSKLAAARAEAGAPVTQETRTADAALLEGLAHAMAKASDPGNKRRIIAPEILKERAASREEMMKLIIDNHARKEVPIYLVIEKTFLAETLIDPQFQEPVTRKMVNQEINWPGVPNSALAPISDSAKEIHTLYLKSIGKKPRDLTKVAAPWVMSAGKILRGRLGAEGPAENPSMGTDPRRLGDRQQKTVNVLGSTAAPAVLGP